MLSLCTYEAVFECQYSIDVPNPAGVLWHSIFGKALHDVACVQPLKKCTDCCLLHTCDYPALFNTHVPPDALLMRRYNNAPSPHVFQLACNTTDAIALSNAVKTTGNTRLRMRFSLIDQANTRLHTVLACLARIAQNGVGKQRQPLRFVELLQVDQSGALRPLAITQHTPQVRPIDIPNPGLDPTYNVRFLTPYRPPGKRSVDPANFDLSAFVMAVIRRIDLLRYFHSSGKLEADFSSLKALSLRSQDSNPKLVRQHAQRYSGTHGKQLDISGLLGTITLQGELAKKLWPYLYTGQFLNVGKNAAMGLGQYSLTAQ